MPGKEVAGGFLVKRHSRRFLDLRCAGQKETKPMFGRNAFPASTFFMVLLVALALLGVGYGLWSKVLFIDGTVHTGNVNAEFLGPFTDDDGTDDGGDCFIGGPGSCDPMAPGPAPERYDKHVATCAAQLDVTDPQILNVVIANGYPSYWCTVWFTVENTGTVPVKVQAYNLTGVPEVLEVETFDLLVGDQLEPDGEESGGFSIHIKQEADETEDYNFTAAITLVQWNEYQEDGAIALCAKSGDPDWTCEPDGATGVLYFDPAASNFDFDFDAEGLVGGTDYTLIYYPDPWPGANLICFDSGTADAEGDLHLVGSLDIGMNLTDAKIWLVLLSDVDCISPTQMVNWNPSAYLFEQTLIDYVDTGP
jgi:hypothetical protein